MNNNSIEIQIDHEDCEVSVETNCILSSSEIDNLISNLGKSYNWWGTKGDIEENGNPDQYLFFSLAPRSKVSLEALAEKLRKKVQKLFPDKLVKII